MQTQPKNPIRNNTKADNKDKTPLPKTSNPAQSALETINVFYLEDLAQFSEKEIADLHGMGPKALRILKEHMAVIGIDFKKDK